MPDVLLLLRRATRVRLREQLHEAYRFLQHPSNRHTLQDPGCVQVGVVSAACALIGLGRVVYPCRCLTPTWSAGGTLLDHTNEAAAITWFDL